MSLKFASILLTTILTSAFLHARDAAPIREKLNFNREWKFQLGDPAKAEAAAFDDTKWENIGLPHSFSMPYFAAGNAFYVGYGWYRKTFDLPDTSDGKCLFLDFEGAFQDAEIFLNGKKIGSHQGGYTGFEVEITKAAKPGRNVLAVRLNNLWNAQLAPRAGEHTFSGGLYRNVWLVAANPLHVTWYGTFVTTPKVSTESGTANVKTEVVNQSSEAKTCGLRTEIIDPSGKVVASMSATQMIAPGKTVTFDQTSAALPNPKLWSPETPALYRAVSTVSDGATPADSYETSFGFRSIQWTADKGFFLNGKHRYFKGANVHQDHAGWGDAVTESGMARDVRMMKEAGFDLIRGSHYPHAPGFARACDEQGMLFWSENAFWGTGGFKGDGYWNCSAYPVNPADGKPFEASVKQQLAEMIRIHRNHPSIVVWSMSNEPFFSDNKVMPKVREFLKELIDETHKLDPTRPAAIGGCQRGDFDKVGDIAGYNGDGARLFVNPGVASVVSEYGSTIADRPGKYESGWGELPSTPGATKGNPDSWRMPWRSGEAIWCGFDHGSIAGRNFGAMGLVDYYRLPKRSWYWYRNEYTKVPPPEWPQQGTPAGLTLTADKTTLDHVDGTDDSQVVVTVVDSSGKPISNSVPVTLSIESGPGEFPTGPSITFEPKSDIAIRDGQAAIEFRSYHAGTTVIRASSPGLKDASITITSSGGPAYVAGETPPVKPRAYRPVTEQSGQGTAATYGPHNPTRASSEAPGYSGGLANDGDPETSWLAATASNAWWGIDLERIVAIQKFALTFPEEGDWRYRIEVSDDGKGWKPAIDRTKSTATTKERTDDAASGTTGRFVRVTLTGSPAGPPPGISEFSATGTLAR
ncbi:glycoside hydrolase family 2 TIM barrel-domain containing protein [Luteolibacter sp.]|uniref:glycoside hydrolase family 2 protein n=1 Tax=Luteolibacter sp. TaxID=1962973 RepID=UPI0032664095